MRGMREEILRLGERMMLCAEAGESKAPNDVTNRSNTGNAAGHILSRQIAPLRIMSPQASWLRPD